MRRAPLALAATLAAGLALAVLPVLTVAPNRLAPGGPVALPREQTWPVLLALLALLATSLARAGRRAALAGAATAFVAMGGLCAIAGAVATQVAATSSQFARVALGAGFWVAAVAIAVAWSDHVRRLLPSPAARAAIGPVILVPPVVLAAAGRLAHLSLAREYAAETDFWPRVGAHLALVGLSLAIAAPVGLVLGWASWRVARLRGPVLGTLGLVQTIPSVALFGLLIAPLAAAGLGGIGTLPAVIALVAYGLLPVARTTAEAFAGVPAATRDAADGMGMTSRQRLLAVDIPLALPTLVSGLRVATVQTIGLAVVAALIGAGGLGAIVFAGLAADALDQVLLGALPVMLLAALADALFRLLAAFVSPAAR